MPTDDVQAGRCDHPLMPWSRPNFPFNSNYEFVGGVCWRIDAGPPLVSHYYYSWRCQRMVFELAGAISPSCLHHTKIPFGSSREIDVDYVEK